MLPNLSLFPAGYWPIVPWMILGFWLWATGWQRVEAMNAAQWSEWDEWEREFQEGQR